MTKNLPVACYYQLLEGTAWALNSQEIQCQFFAEMYKHMGTFVYPLQYVIRIFQNCTTSYPTETQKFFQEELGIRDRNIYYADSDLGGS